MPGVTGYAANGNIVAYSDSVNGYWTLGYDALNRLTSSAQGLVNGGFNSYGCWSYDSFGNRTEQATSNQAIQLYGCQPASGASSFYATTMQFADGTNRITARGTVTPSGTQSVAAPGYDSAGNLITDQSYGYVYDGQGHMCAAHTAQGMVGYIYDAEGNRVAKGTITAMTCDPTANGFALTTLYELGPNGQPMTEVDNGAWSHTDVYAGGLQVATYDGNGVHFQLHDWLGTRRVQTNYAGVVEDACSSNPYGDGQTCSNPVMDSSDQHFTGQPRDTESGLDFFEARHFASTMGRFMNPDPSGLLAQKPQDPQSWNLYAYVRNNPLINIDPNGLDCIYADDLGTAVQEIDHNSNSGECGQNGGTWAPGYVDENWAHFNRNTNMFQVGSVDGAGNNATVDYTNFQAGAQTDANGNCLSGCGGYGFASANADWLQGQLVGNSQLSGLDGYIQFLTGREQQLSSFSQFAFGPLDPSQNNWAGPGGMGPPQGTGDWKASVHDYNFSTNGITIGSYFNPSLSPATSRALIQSNNFLMQTGGFQGAKEKLFFGVVNAFQWATHIF